MTAPHAATANPEGQPDDTAKRRIIDDLAARLAVIQADASGSPAVAATSGGSRSGESDSDESRPDDDSGSDNATGSNVSGSNVSGSNVSGSNVSAFSEAGSPGEHRRAQSRRPDNGERVLPRSRRSDGPVPIGGSGTVGPTRPDRRRDVDPAGHPEDDPGDPEAVARAICLRLLTGAARPRAGLAAALRLRGIPDEVADRVLDRFTEVGLIDDRAYAEAFVAAKHRERALGATALRTELRRKGVDEEIVLHAVQTIDQDAERDRARALISKRVEAALVNGEPAARRRLVGLLSRRGYSPEVAFAVVNEVLEARRGDRVSD